MRGVRAGLGAAFVAGSFFAFFGGGWLFATYFGAAYGTYTNASRDEVLSFVLMLVLGSSVSIGTLLFSWAKYGRNLWQLLILLSSSVFVADLFVISTDLYFPVFMPNSGMSALAILVLSLFGTLCGTRGFFAPQNSSSQGKDSRQSISSPSRSITKPPRATVWSILIAAIGGVFGLVALDFPLFGMYMETPPPLLGQPIGYQTIPNCNAGPFSVCVPFVHNSILIASIDFIICFGVTLIIAYGILRGFASHFSSSNILKRNSLPALLSLIALLVVSSSAAGSVMSGASLAVPHWPTPSGVEVYPLNMAIYSGSSSTPSSQGTARMTLILANYYWTDLNISIAVSISGSNISQPVSVYQCINPTSCKTFSSINVPPYTALGLNSTKTALYLGIQVEKGANYHYQLNLTGEGLISNGDLTAL